MLLTEPGLLGRYDRLDLLEGLRERLASPEPGRALRGLWVVVASASLTAIKLGAPSSGLWEYTMDTCHTPYYAAGYLFKKVKPRIGAICHFEWSGDAVAAESVAQVLSRLRPFCVGTLRPTVKTSILFDLA